MSDEEKWNQETGTVARWIGMQVITDDNVSRELSSLIRQGDQQRLADAIRSRAITHVEHIVGPDDGLVSPMVEADLQRVDFEAIADNHIRMAQARDRMSAARHLNMQSRVRS